MSDGVSTKADPGATGWAIRDPVTCLRRRDDDRVFPLGGTGQLLVGTSVDCAIRLDDAEGVSRQHASLTRQGDAWVISDLGSTNGTRQDGEDRASFALAPGMEVELGRAKLIAESHRSAMLWGLLRRLLGWSRAKLGDVDNALQVVRQMANLRSSLIIRGDGSMTGTARALHHLVLGEHRPMSIHAAREPGIAAVDRARDGMLVLDADHLPTDLAHVLVSCRLPEWRVRVVIGTRSDKLAAQVAARIPRVGSFAIPPLSEREHELEQLLVAYADDAVASLKAPGRGLRPHDLQWIRKGGVKNLDEAEEVMTRVVAVRNWGVTVGAERVGVTHGALSKYLRRRSIPT